MFDAGLDALTQIFQPEILFFVLIGVCIGSLIGILPGMGGIVGASVLIPFVVGMDPLPGVALLMGMLAVVHTADSFPSILLGVPGTAGSQATILDGHALARAGKAEWALGAAFGASMMGGLLGALLLIPTIGLLRPLVLLMGTHHLFLMTMFGLTLIGVLSSHSRAKGLAAGLLGMLLGLIGGAPGSAEFRYTFGSTYLLDGVSLAILALALFGLPELFDLIVKNRTIAGGAELRKGRLKGVGEAFRSKLLVVRSTLIGMGFGIMPGLGGAVADWVAYGAAKKTETDGVTFGEGNIKGVIAPEAANNPKDSGALVPTLLFGVPGVASMALVLGALAAWGFMPGPGMVSDDLPFTFTIIWIFALANVMATLLCLSLAPLMSRMTNVQPGVLVPLVIVFMAGAAYQATYRLEDLILLAGLSIVGWLMKELDWPRPPLLVGFVLGGPAERYYYISEGQHGYSWLTFPSTLFMIAGFVLLLLLVGGGGRRWAQVVRRVRRNGDGHHGS